MSGSFHADILVSGAGMVGATLGLALALDGLQVALAERRNREQCLAGDLHERCSLVNTGASQFLESLGIPVSRLGIPVERMRVWDAEHAGSIQLDAADAGASFLGYIVENRRLEQALHQRLQEMEVPLLYGTRLEHQHTGPQSSVLSDSHGALYHTTLLAIAEGRQSTLRRTLFRASVFGEDYRQEAITATIWTERPHGGTAYQRFLPDGPLALLPFTNGPDGEYRTSMVWSARRPLARKLMALETPAFLEHLQQAFGPQLGRLTRMGTRGSHPLSAMHVNRYVGDRVVLLGDSAHGVHPLAGLGVNLGFRDAAALRQTVSAARSAHQDWGNAKILETYQRLRRPDNLVTVFACSVLNHLFTNRSRTLASLRDLGMLGTAMTPRLRRFFIQQAIVL